MESHNRMLEERHRYETAQLENKIQVMEEDALKKKHAVEE